MNAPPALDYSGRRKWPDVAFNLFLVAGGIGLIAVALAQPTMPPGLGVLVAYTVFAVAVSLVFALVLATTRRLPTLEEAVLDGEPRQRVRQSMAFWWHSVALDAGLAAGALALVWFGVRAGGELVWISALVALVALWFLGKVLVALTGLRPPAALWAGAGEVVVDGAGGRARAPLSSIGSVRGRGDRVVVSLTAPAQRRPVPLPWRRKDGSADDLLVFDAGDTGHRAVDLADWLQAMVDRSGVSGGPRRGRSGS